VRTPTAETDSLLASCHGFSVDASDEPLGVVETPVFSGKGLRPDSLIVRTAAFGPGCFARVPVAFVTDIDPDLLHISLGASRGEILRRPNSPPQT
jgi:hypothetical protein